MRLRLEKVEDLSGRLGTLEDEAGRLSKEMAEISTHADDHQKKVDELTLQVDALLTRMGRFQEFIYVTIP